MFRHRMFFCAAVSLIAASVGRGQPSRVSMTQLAMPESMIYFLLRDRTDGSTVQRANLERNLRLFRAYAHDHRRQVDRKWLTPREFVRRREAADSLQREAQSLFRQAESKRDPTRREKLAMSRARAAAESKLQKAAGAWTDPTLRRFLLGVAALDADDVPRAEGLFAQCVEDDPRITAFYQARAEALMGLKRYTDALRTYMQALSMQPESRYAVAMLQDALQNVPGSHIDTPAYRDAKNMLANFQTSRNRRASRLGKSTHWLFPGKPVRSREHTLPDLPMDRFVVLQALGVPVSEHTLLVDGRILQNADEVLVQVNPRTLAPVTKRRTYRRKMNQPPITLISVPDYKFQPRDVLSGDPKPDEPLTMHAVNIYTEMGGDVRRQPVKVLANRDGYATAPDPALTNGESAGILLTDKGELAGVVVRDLDVMKDFPKQDVYVTTDLADLLKQIQKRSSPRTSKRTIQPKDAPGEVFLVYAIRGERFEEK